jgi:hypothetical protein
MKTLSTPRTISRAAILLLGGLSSLFVQACHGGPFASMRPWQAYTLPAIRTSGTWKAPRDPAERQRLNAIVRAHFASFQECQWRHAGYELVGSPITPPPSPVMGTFGVDAQGHVVWFEMSSSDAHAFSLRECLSERLIRLQFVPPPAEPVMLVLTLPQLLKRSRVSRLNPTATGPERSTAVHRS